MGAPPVHDIWRDALYLAALPHTRSHAARFLSSTSRDLEEHRKAVLGVLLRSENFPVAMEWFGAQPAEPVDVCLQKVRQSAAFVLIVAHRYGWVPMENDAAMASGAFTWLETAEALRCGKPVLAYVVDPAYLWTHGTEQDDLIAAVDDASKADQVLKGVRGLRDFSAGSTPSAPGPGRVQQRRDSRGEAGDGAAETSSPCASRSRPDQPRKLREVHVLQPAALFVGAGGHPERSARSGARAGSATSSSGTRRTRRSRQDGGWWTSSAAMGSPAATARPHARLVVQRPAGHRWHS
jgi:hypothetical protein